MTAALALGLSFALHLWVPALPVMTLAVIFGIAAANIPGLAVRTSGPLSPGLTFAGKHLMRVGIVFLGLKVSLAQIVDLGWISVALVVAVVLLSFAGTYALGKAFRLGGDTPLLIATGFSICGASAIGAMAAVKGTKHHDTVLPVALVTLCGTLAIGVLPLLMRPLGLGPLEFGQWVGAGVHDVGQVVATAQTAGAVALGAAIVVKLTRVLMLAPIVAAVSVVERRRPTPRDGAPAKAAPLVPLFVLGFLAMALLRTTGVVQGGAVELGALIQDLALGMALFGLGSSVRIHELLDTGLRAMAMALCSWALIASLAFAAVMLMAG
ncbi:YeiH family protein [Specibacter sp. NPDC057265]|uniref:YeiH family protein n=1 Tax=Specibacter sp. NPDC057265 TaxID=3346075 RepID=UPI00362E2B12